MAIRLLEGAKEDLRNAWFFYERQTTGLGDRFLDAIEADVRLLPGYPGIHLQVDGFHRMLIKRPPCALYYLFENTSIDIYAILDFRRDPNWIRQRLGRTGDLG
jgi:plasmid stabilization system protein ParE